MTKNELEICLTNCFSPTHIAIDDESHKHAGHRGTHHTENTHFSIVIVSHAFEGKSLIMRHRMVYNQLKTAFSNQLHAVKITAKTPNEWASS